MTFIEGTSQMFLTLSVRRHDRYSVHEKENSSENKNKHALATATKKCMSVFNKIGFSSVFGKKKNWVQLF